MVRLDKDKFKDKFSDWWPYIEPGFHLLEPIYEHLKEQGRKHVKIFPKSANTFRAFTACPKKDIVGIWCGMSPYFTIHKGEPIADGLCFSSNGEGEPPSLKILYDAMEQDLDEVFLERPLKLDYIAEQGVLMLNAAFTTEQGKADSHIELWKPFTEFLAKEVFPTGIPILTFGNAAKEAIEPQLTNNHIHKHVKHPSYFNRLGKPMEHENCFTWFNEQIVGNNGAAYRIEFNYHDVLPF